jgi:hypothetical protein
MDRPTIFIGSSSEGCSVARAIKEQFDAEADVDVWNEDVFQLNSSFLESLLRAVNLYDFAVLVFTPDDTTTSRGDIQQTPRDNVLFEHGLFLGRLGPKRAFIICEEQVKVPSDFAGITIAKYRRREDGNLKSAVGTACNQIRSAINEQMKRSELGLLPSTALAIGYHQNFIRKVVSELIANRRKLAGDSGITKIICVREDQPDGSKKDVDKTIPISYDDFVLQILIPTEDLSELAPDGLKSSVQNLVQITLKTPYRPFPFYISASEKEIQQTAVLELFDIPTTLLASRKAIELILGKQYVGPSRDQDKLEKREIKNFEKTLAYLIQEDFGKITPYLKLKKIATLTSLP